MNNKFLQLKASIILILILACCSDPENVYYENLENAFKALQANQPKDALEFASAAIKIRSFDHVGYVLRGRAYYEQDLSEFAKKDFAAAIALDSNNTTALFYYGLILYDKHQYDSSINYLNRAITSKGGESFYFEYSDKFLKYSFDENVTMGSLKYFRGLAYYYGGNINSALNDFAFAADEGYNKGKSLYYIGLIALEKDELGLACKYFRLAKDNGYDKADGQISSYCQ